MGGSADTSVSARQAGEIPEPSVGRLPALDGIRAIGIILVLFFHGGFGWAGGGFFGVDVFFVLSGFLITGLLVSEFRQNSGIGLRRFWLHRIRRLVPALLAMLVAVALYGVFFAPPDTLAQLRSDAIATLLYGNNWHQVSGGQGYFAALYTPRPLLHTWSLSIEEQFYLVWPLVVLGLLHWTRSLRVLLGVTVVGAVASAVEMASLFHGGVGESRAYYGTDTRAQALLIGAALAIALANPITRGSPGADRSTPTPSLVRPIRLSPVARLGLVAAGGIGLAVVAWMAFTTDSTAAWIYRGGFGLIALATAAVIASVALVPASPWTWALSLRPIRYIGAISYGLYLWHWPIFVLVDSARTGLSGWPLFILRVALTVGVSAASYHFLEMPIRRGALKGWRGWAATPLAVGGTAALVLASTAGATPALGALASKTAPLSPAQYALAATGSNTPVVAAGTKGPIRALMLGDSEASFLGFGLGPPSAAYNVNYAGDGTFGCGFQYGATTLNYVNDPGTMGTRSGNIEVPCRDQLTRWKADLETFHPDVVLVANGEYEVRNRLLDGTWTHIGEPGFDAAELHAIRTAVQLLRSTGAVVVLLTAPYYHQPEEMSGASWPEDDPQRVNTYNALLRQVAAESKSGVVVEDLNAHLDPHGQYTQYLDHINVRFADGIHVTAAGASLVAPWMLSRVEALGTANRAASMGASPAPAGAATASAP